MKKLMFPNFELTSMLLFRRNLSSLRRHSTTSINIEEQQRRHLSILSQHHRSTHWNNSRYFDGSTPNIFRTLSSTSSINHQKESPSSSSSSQTAAAAKSTNLNQITGHNIIIDDENQKIHYEKSGNGQQIILLMPGALGTGKSDFLPQLSHLNGDEFTLIAWDPPGYGQSFPPERDFNDFYRRDAMMAAKLMKKLNYSRYSILGWSDGGITGLILASLEPKSIQKLIVWGSNAYVSEEDRHLLGKVRNPRTDWSEAFRNVFIDIYGEEQFYRLWDRWVAYYLTLNDICREDLPKIECPVLILHGDRDPMVSPEHPVYLVNNIPNATLFRFEKGKHNIHQRYADEFNRLVEDFITTN